MHRYRGEIMKIERSRLPWYAHYDAYPSLIRRFVAGELKANGKTLQEYLDAGWQVTLTERSFQASRIVKTWEERLPA